MIDADIRAKISADLRCSPRQFGYLQNLWDSKLLSHHLLKQYAVRLGERQ